MCRQKVFKTLNFWVIDTWNNIDQLQRSGSYIRMSDVDIWVGRIRPQIFLAESFSFKYNTCSNICFLTISTQETGHDILSDTCPKCLSDTIQLRNERIYLRYLLAKKLIKNLIRALIVVCDCKLHHNFFGLVMRIMYTELLTSHHVWSFWNN